MNLKKHRFTKRKKVKHLASGQRTFASAQAHAFLNGLAAVAVIAFISFYFFLTPKGAAFAAPFDKAFSSVILLPPFWSQ